MNKILISCEGTCDLTKELCEKYNIQVLGLNMVVNDVEYNNITNPIPSKEFYDSMRQDKKSSTSQINQYDAKNFLENFVKQGYDVVHISFSKTLSGTYNNFVSAQDELNEVYGNKIKVIDSLCASCGQGFACMLVSEFNDGTHSFEEVAEYAENICKHISHVFIVDNLKYLSRTGRISKLLAKIGTILQIKPVLHNDENGCLTSLQKVISRKKSILTLANKAIETKNDLSNQVIVGHADCIEDAQFLADKIKEGLNIEPIILEIGPIIGSHSGPGTLAVFYTSDVRA